MCTNEFKGTKAITLIALVVTIVVILILAGVSVGLIVGENGIVGRAVTARKVHGTQETLEKIKLAISSAQIKGLGKVDEDALKKDLTGYFGADGYTITGNSTDGWTISVVKDKVSYFVSPSARMEETEYEEPIDNSQSLVLGLVDDLGTRSTIYLYNNTDKITDGSITITMPDSSTETIVAQADTSNIEYSEEENRYATYTVSKNGTYTFSATANGETTETIVRIKNIEKFTPIEDLGLSFVNSDNKAYSYKGASVPAGYFVDTKSDVDTGLVVTDEIDSEGYSTGNEWVWVPVNSTVGNDDYYQTATGNMYLATSVSYSKYSKLYSFLDKTRESYGTFHPRGTSTGILSTPSDYGNSREPSVLVDEDGWSYEGENLTSITNRQTKTMFTSSNTIEDLATQYVTDYNSMVTSVDTYRGFYIGRYEITEDGEKPGESLVNKQWYEFYNECMIFGKTNTESGMIYGALWDATMQWLTKSNYSVGYTGKNTSGYGNYSTEAVTVGQNGTTIIIKPVETRDQYYGGNYAYTYYVGVVLETGQTSYTRSNNIYDLSGNCYDWTQEALYSGSRVYRGGSYGDSDGDHTYSAYRRFNESEADVDEISSRPCFYIK